jgi:tRNA(fMet)-specific endonuclease VapC
MTRIYMIDANTVSYIARGRSRIARTKLLSLPNNSFGCISAVTEAEIRYGLAKRPEAIALQGLMDAFLASIRVLPWGRDEAQAYGNSVASETEHRLSQFQIGRNNCRQPGASIVADRRSS